MQEQKLIKEKFLMLYRLIKEIAEIPFSTEIFVDKARIFSIPIFNGMLFFLTSIKLFLVIIYFFFWEKNLKNIHIIFGFTLLILTILFMMIKYLLKIKMLKIFGEYYILRIMRVIYIIIFLLDENLTYYNHKEFTFQINSGYIFFIFCMIIFYESQNFTTGLLYIYILNFLLFLYLFSVRNCLGVYLPINSVIVIFITIYVIVHNFGRILIKREVFIKFFESIIDVICKEQNINISYDNQIIYPLKENKEMQIQSRKNSFEIFNDLMEDNKRDFNDSDILSTINEKKFDIFHIDEFEGFDVCIPINQEILKKNTKINFRKESMNNYFENMLKMNLLEFLNLTLYLKNIAKNDYKYLIDLEEFYEINAKNINSKVVKNELLNMKNQISLRDRIIIEIIELIISKGCEKAEIKINDILNNLRIFGKKFIFEFSHELDEKIFQNLNELITDICVTFKYEVKSNLKNNSIIIKKAKKK